MIYTFTANPSLDKLYILEELKAGQYNRGEVARYDPGGKGINVSRCLKAFGVESVILGFFAGSTGDWLIKTLRKQGLTVDPVNIAGESRSNITLIERAAGRMTKLNENGPSVDQAAYQSILLKALERTRPGDIWVLSGSLAPGMPDDFYARLVDAIKSRQGMAFLDSSGKWLIHGYRAVPDLLRINTEEAEIILDRKLITREDLFEALAAISRSGISLSAISLGPKGAIFSDSESLYEVNAPKVTEETTVGAGDAMMAAIIYGYIQKWPMEKIAAWSVAAGSASVMQAGTAAVSPDQVLPLLDQVNVKKFHNPVIKGE